MGLKINNMYKFFRSILLVIIVIIVILLIVNECNNKKSFVYDPDFNGSLNLTDIGTYQQDMKARLDATNDPFEKGVIYLNLARVDKDEELYEKACKEFMNSKTKSAEEQAILYERLSQVNCKGERDRWDTLARESRLLEKEISHALLNYSK
jgi:hypothetical protein